MKLKSVNLKDCMEKQIPKSMIFYLSDFEKITEPFGTLSNTIFHFRISMGNLTRMDIGNIGRLVHYNSRVFNVYYLWTFCIKNVIDEIPYEYPDAFGFTYHDKIEIGQK